MCGCDLVLVALARAVPCLSQLLTRSLAPFCLLVCSLNMGCGSSTANPVPPAVAVAPQTKEQHGNKQKTEDVQQQNQAAAASPPPASADASPSHHGSTGSVKSKRR